MANDVNITTLLNPLNLVAPVSCEGCGQLGEALCPCCKNDILFERENLCLNCKTDFLRPETSVFTEERNRQPDFCASCGFLPSFFVGWRDGLVGKMVHDYKYHSLRALARPLAELLDESLPFFEGEVVVVPMPTIWRHVRERGFDHILLIAKKLAKLRGYKVSRMIVRAKNTVQVGADARERREQARSAYRMNPRKRIEKEKIYLIIDDVWTTGATMKAGVRVLTEAGAEKIVVATLAANRKTSS